MIRKILPIILLIFAWSSSNGQKPDIQVYDFNQFEKFLQYSNDTTYVVNFWATWCKPCVKELPYFEAVTNELSAKKVRVLLVSLDDIDNLSDKLIPFVNKMGLKSDVILLNDVNYNSWIDKVDPSWSGAIPATLIYNKNYRGFFEQSFEYDELLKIINQKRIKS